MKAALKIVPQKVYTSWLVQECLASKHVILWRHKGHVRKKSSKLLILYISKFLSCCQYFMIGASIARGYLRNGVGLGSYQPRPRQSIDQYLVQTNDFFHGRLHGWSMEADAVCQFPFSYALDKNGLV